MSKEVISTPVIRRLPRYYRFLGELTGEDTPEPGNSEENGGGSSSSESGNGGGPVNP